MQHSGKNSFSLSRAQIEKLATKSINIWAEVYQIKTETGVPLDFRDHLFLYDIYADWSPKIACFKAAQMGFTTLAVNKSFWAVKNIGLDGIYTMPTGGDIVDFVGGKVNRIIAQNPILQEWVADRDTIEQKKIGDHVLYYRGTMTERAAISVASDLNIHDEEDRSDQNIIAMYSSRQQHSRYKWEWHFSNPSVEGNGVSRYWPRSDQKHWFVDCKKCKERQYLSWPDSVCRERRIFQCKKCKAELSREDRRVGSWLKKWEDREYSGYWMSLLMAPWVTATEIIDYYETKPIDFFYNFVLGLPYVGEGNTVPVETLLRNCTDTTNDQDRAVIGCDSGITKHYVVGNRQGLFYYGKTNTWDDIRKILREHQSWIAVIDAMPDITEPRKLVDEFPGRVFICHYVRDRKTMQLIRWGRGDEEGFVTVDRNRLMQVHIDEFAAGAIPINGRRDEWMEWASHYKTMFRTTEIDALGMPVFEWKTSNGLDHFCHATNYWRAGMDRFGWGAGAVLEPPGGSVRDVGSYGPHIQVATDAVPIPPGLRRSISERGRTIDGKGIVADDADWRDV